MPRKVIEAIEIFELFYYTHIIFYDDFGAQQHLVLKSYDYCSGSDPNMKETLAHVKLIMGCKPGFSTDTSIERFSIIVPIVRR